MCGWVREQLRLGPPEQQKKHVNDTSCSQSRKRQKGDRKMALTFREQIEATAWELGNGEGTTPELRKRFDADSETPNFDPTKALEMLHILQLINYKQAGKGRGRARCHYLKKPEYGLLNLNEPKPAPKDERERENRIQWAKDFRVIADWLDANCYTTESEEA
ncbi:hypothetical protein BLIG_01508 [Bifidobacterium longum subsp. infantis CCUG 52486]|uniref:Uncharacterized protein n=3 Tax=Bifidobacterium longum TaxID=216816 RepID=C5ECM6_BIFLI|nr:hypothetical protein BLIG_01508 [Bifidobacterium longum subsp. infantis CCUG 52486]